jgi:hypothetical protein
MGDVAYDAVYYAPVPAEQVLGMGVVGPPVDQPEDQDSSREASVQRESAEYSDEAVGRNVDVEA